ncbi:DNA double-strand break repair protein Mre11 [uncultured archaeon]|nr:DNA double-strand break repair protein Mre11 [uncultured archaeon]
MKFGIASDFHFGFNGDAAIQAKKALDLCNSLNCDFILLPGDLFDYRIPTQETIKEAVNCFVTSRPKTNLKISDYDSGKELSDYPALIGIHGTHERRTKGLANIIEIFDDAHLMINCHNKRIIFEKTTGGKTEKVCIQGLGGVPEEFVLQSLKAGNFKPVENAFNVFVFHQNVSEIVPMAPESISVSDLPDGFNLYVNGHIHWHRDLTVQGKHLVIPGSTVVTQMKEEETKPKGVLIVDTNSNVIEFKEFETRKFLFLSTDNQAKAEKFVLDACNSFSFPLIKLKFNGIFRNKEEFINSVNQKCELFLEEDFEDNFKGFQTNQIILEDPVEELVASYVVKEEKEKLVKLISFLTEEDFDGFVNDFI